MKYVIKHLLSYFKEHKKRYSVVLVFMIINSAMAVVPTYIIRLFVDVIIQKTLTFELLTQYGLFFAGAILVCYVSDFIWTYNIFIGSYDLQRQLRGQLMDHFLHMGAPFYQKFRTGDLMTRSTDDVQVMGMTVGYGLMVFMNTSLFLSFILVMMAVTVSWKLTLIALLPMPFLAYFIFKWGSEVDKLFTESQKAVSEMNSEVLEIVEGTRVVRAFGLEKETKRKFEQKTLETRNKNNEVAVINARFGPLITIVLALSFVASFGVGAFLVEQQQITVGGMVSFQVYLTMIVWPMISAGDLVNVMQQGSASWRRINEVLASGDDLEKTGSEKIDQLNEICFENYHFNYPASENLVLKGLDLTIKAGDVVGVVGKTGSGKTTLLRQLEHRYPYSAEQPLLNGEPLTDYATRAVRGQFAEVPQEHTLFSRSIKENLLFGNLEASEAELWEALEIASLAEDIKNMPEGLETLVGEKGVSLSGGQKQRLSLARAFLRESSVLLLDDALSAVDAKTEQSIINQMRDLPNKPTSLIVTHRLSAITQANQIIVLDEGAIIQRGTHQELIKEPGWYQEQYLHQQVKAD